MAYPTVTHHHKRFPHTSIMASPYSADPTGVVSCVAGVTQLLADISNSGTIYVPKGTFLVATNLTIPAGVMVVFEAGASFSVSVGATLTLNGPVVAGPYDLFSGAGTVVIGAATLIEYGAWTGGSGITFDGLATFSTIPALPASDPTTVNQAVRKAYADTKVSLTGDEVVAGIKTFSSIPVLPASNPTTDNQASRKLYVDTKVSLTGDEAIAGIKTFSSIPVLPASDPTTDNQATRKAFVDSAWVDYSAISTITGWSAFTTKIIMYKKIGKIIFLIFDLAGTSNTTTAEFTVPTGVTETSIVLRIQDNGTYAASPGQATKFPGTSVICYKTLAGGAFTASGTKRVVGQFFYDTA